MVSTKRQYQKKEDPWADLMELHLELKTYEVIVQCPVCCSMETIEFIEGRLPMVSGNWHGKDGEIYHNLCGHPARILS